MRETDVVRRELSQTEVEKLFVEGVDEMLADRDAIRLKAELDADPELKQKYESYARAVKRLREQPKEKAPDALATLVMRRVRRRRGARRLQAHADYRFPVEVIIPLLLAALVALFLVMAGP